MKTRRGSIAAALLLLASAGPACALELFDSGVTALSASDPTQFGRMARDGVASDWSSAKSFPGTLDLATSYHYTTFDVSIVDTPYVQVSFNEMGGTANLFAAAYLDSYSPADESINYLGDAGTSGNFGAPLTFQVVVPTGHTVVVLVNDTSGAGAGVGTNFDVRVDGFIDTAFHDPGGVPEPAEWAMLLAGLFGAGGLVRRRRGEAGSLSAT